MVGFRGIPGRARSRMPGAEPQGPGRAGAARRRSCRGEGNVCLETAELVAQQRGCDQRPRIVNVTVAKMLTVTCFTSV